LHSGQEKLKKVAYHHFSDFYKNGLTPPIREQVQMVAHYKEMINNMEFEFLYKPVDLKELQEVIYNFKVDKSSGPDG